VAQFAKGALITIKTIRASLGHKLIQGDDRHCREKGARHHADRPVKMNNSLRLKRLGIDTYDNFVVYLRQDSDVCRAEGFSSHTRVRVEAGGKSIIATLNFVVGDILSMGEAGLSEGAWQELGQSEGAMISVSHSRPIDSLAYIRAKIDDQPISNAAFSEILSDIAAGYYSDIHLSSFVTACAARPLSISEITGLTSAMINCGERMTWPYDQVVDKHCVGGLPGNRTTPIVVSIVAACGLRMPKTSSRAITSPAGTADTMETLAPVDLSVEAMQAVVEREGGCVVWGGAVDLSPTDDTLIRIERALDLDSESQLIASVLSKKIAAGSTHVVIDIPTGTTAKISSQQEAASLSRSLTTVADTLGLKARVVISDGSQPVGRGIGPSLEAMDVLAVLRNEPAAPADLRNRAVTLASVLLEMGGAAAAGDGIRVANETLDSGLAWAKFQAICEAQGGMRTPPLAPYTREVLAERPGHIRSVDNRRLSRAARLCGAPEDKPAGIKLHVALGQQVESGQPMFTLHADAPGELEYAYNFIMSHPPIYEIGEQP
jgi:thymidine phosphorylase